MNKLTCVNYIFVFLILPFGLLCQTNDRFIGQAIEDELIEHKLNEYFTDFSLIHLPAQEIEAFLQQPQPEYEMLWIMPGNIVWDMTLEPARILSQTFDLYVEEETGRRLLSLDKHEIHTFRSQKTEDDHRLTVNGDFIYGYTVQQGEEWYIEPANHFAVEAEAQTYVIYQSRNVRPIPNLKCGSNDRANAPDIEAVARGGRNACYEVELAIAADYSMYEFYNSALGVFTQLEGVINNVSGNFDTEFSEEIRFKISEMVVSACQSCDPWTNTNEASDVLVDFKEWGSGNEGFINDFDLAEFWTRRPLEEGGSGSVIGLAYVGAICTNSRFHILEDFTASAGYLRVLTAHEIGHNFGCVHNFNTSEFNCFDINRPDHIMDPMVNNASLWADGVSSICTENSMFRIESTLSENSCLANCSNTCGPVHNMQAQFDASIPSLQLNWVGESEQEFRVRIRDLEKNTYQEFFTHLNTIDLDSSSLELCTEYEVIVDCLCDEEYGRPNSILVSTEAQSVMRISNIQTRNCQTGSNTYDLDLFIEYDEIFDEGFTIRVGEQIFEKNYTSSPQFVKIEGLQGDGVNDKLVIVKSNSYTSDGCAASAVFQTPDRACSYKMEADFNDCQLPTGWRYSNTYTQSSDWGVADSSRLIANFLNTSGNTTINGDCMAYFDDDLLGPSPQFSGTSSLLTTVMDLDNYDEITCSFTYNFNAYYSSPHTAFIVDVFDGNNWVNILTDHEGSGCLPSNAWGSSCNTYVEFDLSPYENDLLQLRFSYSDGGQWAEFVAMDDFVLSAVKDASLLPVELVQFSAKTEAKKVVLNWSTAQEINNDYFEIERSVDGRQFVSIGKIQGIGNSQQRQYYTHHDHTPHDGVNYYRLRQVDKDGAFQYSHIVSATMDANESWRAYPNPLVAGSLLNIERLGDTKAVADFQLLNTSGQLLGSYRMDGNENGLDLDLGHLIPGVYVLREVGGRSIRLVK